MKLEDEKSTKDRFLAEYKRHIEQMIQTINCAPIYSRKLLWKDISIYFQIKQVSYKSKFPTKSYNRFSNPRSKNKSQFYRIYRVGFNRKLGRHLDSKSFNLCIKERSTSLVSNEISFEQIGVSNIDL